MHRTLLFAAFGWLTLTGIAHFAIDVVSHHLRGKRAPGAEALLYYGLHSTYALSQFLFGLTCLWLAVRHPALVQEWPFAALCVTAVIGWLAINLAYIEYWEPKVNLGIFAALLIAAFITRP